MGGVEGRHPPSLLLLRNPPRFKSLSHRRRPFSLKTPNSLRMCLQLERRGVDLVGEAVLHSGVDVGLIEVVGPRGEISVGEGEEEALLRPSRHELGPLGTWKTT
jgi:hypothetical protein